MDALFDSNVIIDFIGKRLPVSATLAIDRFLQAPSFNSIISRIEVMVIMDPKTRWTSLKRCLAV